MSRGPVFERSGPVAQSASTASITPTNPPFTNVHGLLLAVCCWLNPIAIALIVNSLRFRSSSKELPHSTLSGCRRSVYPCSVR